MVKATCAILEPVTDKILSERFIGWYENEDIATSEAFKQKLEGEDVVIYTDKPITEEEEDLSPREMAEREIDWMDHLGEL